MGFKKTENGEFGKQAAKAVSRSALLLGASLSMISFAAPAMAQEAATAEEDDEAIVVTGTRIRQRDFETASPIATVGADEIALTGTLNVEELLNSLPQVVPGLTVTSNNPSLNGFATADLRGLGPGRTLILVNGRRANPSDRSGAVDLNTIPAALIERVELITGGASAVYGADAVAGAINFILRDDFEGIETNLSYGSAWDGIAPEYAFDVTMGTPFADGRGNITAFAGYYSRSSAPATDRPWTGARGVALDPNGNTVVVPNGFVLPTGWSGFNPGGSGTSPWGSVAGGFSAANIAAVTGLTLDADCNPGNGVQSTGGTIRFNAAGGIEPYQNCALNLQGNAPGAVSDGDRYDFAPDNFLVLENERINAAVFAEYDLNEAVTTFMEMQFTNSRSQQQLAATPVTGLTVNVDLDPTVGTTVINPYVAANSQLLALLNLQYPTTGPTSGLDNRTLSMSIRPNQGGFRVGTVETSALAFTGGLRGDIEFSNIDWEIFGSYARNQTNIQSDNNVGATAIRQLINACGVRTLAVQAAPLTALPNCPFPGRSGATFTPTGNSNNPLGLNSMNAAQLAFINIDATDVVTYERSIVGGYLAGEAGDFWGAGPIGYAFGAEYRQEELDSRVDPFKAAGDIFGFNAQESIQGRYDVMEFYTEVSVPILTDLPFADNLSFEGGYRYSNYSTGAGRTDTYKAGLEYSPVEWLNFRGIYNRAVRSPTAFELFQAGDQNFPGYADPCTASAVNALSGAAQTTRIATCNAWFNAAGATFTPGVFAATNSQVQSFQVGTPGLQPEIVDTYTYGVVFNPEWWPVGRIGASVDVFLLDLQDGISLRSIANILNGCVAQGGTGADCSLAPRLSNGQIDFVNQTRSNVPGHSEIKGIDYNIRWSYDLAELGWTGEFGVASLVTYLDRNEFGTIGTHDGTIGGGVPEWRAVTSFTYQTDRWSTLLRWSWTDEMEQASFGTEIVPAYSLWSIGTRYDLNDSISLSASVDNIFDEQPPVFTDAQIFGQFNTDGSTYDQLGRAFRIGLTMRH
jgi:outer membrane receptor protein involved in Fe transport